MSDNIYQAPNSELNVSIDADKYEYAGFWIRLAASFVDTIFIVCITLPVLTWIYGFDYGFDYLFDYLLSQNLESGSWDVVINYVLPAIAAVLFWLYRGATPGKMMFGLKIISLGEQEKLSVFQAIGRYLGYYLSMFVMFAGFISVAFDPKKQGWHDKLAKTVVIKTR